MNFDFNEEQRMLEDAVDRLVAMIEPLLRTSA